MNIHIKLYCHNRKLRNAPPPPHPNGMEIILFQDYFLYSIHLQKEDTTNDLL